MNLKNVFLSTLAAISPLTAFAGGEVDFSLSNHSVRLEHDTVLVGTGAYLSTGVLYSEEDSNWAVTAGFNAVDASLANRELIGGVGFKALLLSTQVSDFSAGIGVGGFLRWQPAVMNGAGLEGQFYYSPSIMSFGDLVDAYEGVARVTYKILPQAKVFLGYHSLKGLYDLDGGSNKSEAVDSSFHVGFRLVY